MKIQNKHIIIIVLIAVSAGLAYDSVSNYLSPYIPVSDISANQAKYTGKSLQVIGVVEPGSLIRTDDGSIRFTLIDEQGSIKVTYRGVPPQNLEQEGNQVVVLGTLRDDGKIESSQLLVKCPSKYEDEEQQGISHVFLAAIGVALLGVGYLVITMFYRKP
ncbi:cytochrome c maturation protein CcmE [Thermoproteota archaeon]